MFQRSAGGGQHQHPQGDPGEQIQVVIGKGKTESEAATDGEQHSRVTRQIHLVFNYRLETQLFQGALGVFRGGHIGVRADLNVEEIVRR